MLTATGVWRGIGGQLDAEIPYHDASNTHTHPGWIGGLIADSRVGSAYSNLFEMDKCMIATRSHSIPATGRVNGVTHA
jgi:hypothetical protein